MYVPGASSCLDWVWDMRLKNTNSTRDQGHSTAVNVDGVRTGNKQTGCSSIVDKL